MSKNKTLFAALLLISAFPVLADPAGEMSQRLKKYPEELFTSSLNYTAVYYALGEVQSSGGIKPAALQTALPIISRHLSHQIRQCYADAASYIRIPATDNIACAKQDNANAAFIAEDAAKINMNIEFNLHPKTIAWNAKQAAKVEKYRRNTLAVRKIVQEYRNQIFVVLPLDMMQNQFRLDINAYDSSADAQQWWSLPKIRQDMALGYMATSVIANDKGLPLQTVLTDIVAGCYLEPQGKDAINWCAERDNSYAVYYKEHRINEQTRQWNARYPKQVAIAKAETDTALSLLKRQNKDSLIQKLAFYVDKAEKEIDIVIKNKAQVDK